MLRVDGFGTVGAPPDVLRRVLSGCFRVALGQGPPTVHVGLLDAVTNDADGADASSAPGGSRRPDWTTDTGATDRATPADDTGAGFYVSVEPSASHRDEDPDADRTDAGTDETGATGATGFGRPSSAVAAAVRATAPSTWDVDVRRSAEGDVRVAVRPE
jgi:hypothetical protein